MTDTAAPAASALPDRAYLRELVRPWKLATFAGSLAVLIYGALVMNIGDWDVPVTLIMGVLTYTLAPWCVFLIHRAWKQRPKHWPWHVLLSLALAVFVVDTVYMTYSNAVGNPTDREFNFRASFPLFYLAGVLWSWRGTVRELWVRVRGAFKR